MKKLTLDDTLSEIEERWKTKPLEEKEADVSAGDPSKQKNLSKSSLQELRVKVAKLCPRIFTHVPSPFGPGSVHWREGRDDHGNPVSPGHHVDPLNDLNACAELIDLLADKGWTCRLDNGLDKTWECTFAKNSLPLQQHYAPADKLAVAICRAFVAVMKASDRPGADSVSDVTESANASGVSSPNSSLSPEIVIPALCKAVRRAVKGLTILDAKGTLHDIASILEKKDA